MSAWPTLVMIDPEGYVVGAGAGEFTSESLAPLIVFLIQKSESKGTFKHRAMTVAPDPPTVAPGRLRYPGKVAVQGSRIAIADSGNHRVLTGKLSIDGQSMTVELVVGSGKRGYDNGGSASFNSPQGLAFAERTLYVADAGNHAVRAIDLGSGEVSTVAGTGRQLRTRADREGGALSSDDCLSPTPNNDALKWVDPASRSAVSWVRGLSEPGGVACGTEHAYVADTNAHRILTVSYRSAEVRELTLE